MQQIIHLINEMSPYLLLGFLLAGLMHAFIPGTIYSKYLSKANLRSVLLATLFGIPLPLCSCGVIPTAMSLRKEGASKGATVAFLTATPQTGVDSIIATFALMGLPFAIIRPIVALVTAIFGGQLVNVFDNENETLRYENQNEDEDDGCACSCHSHHHDHEKGAVKAQCGCGCCHDEEEPTTFMGKLRSAFRYAFVDMMEDIGKWLVVGLVIAGLITVMVPDSAFEIFKDNSLTSMLLVLCISVPMYLCATGSIPIAVALMIKGLTPGAALVMLMAGPACNVASMLVINKVMGRRTLIIYLMSIISGAVGFGLIIDHLLPRAWFLSSLIEQEAACCHEEFEPFPIACTTLLLLLLLNALWKHYNPKNHHHHDCCSHEHHHEEEHHCCCGEHKEEPHHEEEHHCCCHKH